MMELFPERIEEFESAGVRILSPSSTLIGDEVEVDQFESGVTIHPNVTIVGESSRFGEGTELGRVGGGYFNNVSCGRNVTLFGGYFEDCVFLDGVKLRGHAEVRGGTLLEEGCEGAHHVGYKMTVMLPWVVAGSLVNFCDAFMAGGRSRSEHSEIGSAMALYNFSPWGDKSASQFGDVPRGVFLREAPIFIGGQTQIVSPVSVGYGSVIPAGMGVRRDVGDNRLYGEAPGSVDRPFDPAMYGTVKPKLRIALGYIANLRALRAWYQHVRHPALDGDDFTTELYAAAEGQLLKGIRERVKRVRKMLDKLPASLEAHRAALTAKADDISYARRHRRVNEHERALSQLDEIEEALDRADADIELGSTQKHVFKKIVREYRTSDADTFVEFLRDDLDDELVDDGQAALQKVVDDYIHSTDITWS